MEYFGSMGSEMATINSRDTDWQLYHYCHSQPAGEGTPYNSTYGEVPAQNWYHFQALGI